MVAANLPTILKKSVGVGLRIVIVCGRQGVIQLAQLAQQVDIPTSAGAMDQAVVQRIFRSLVVLFSSSMFPNLAIHHCWCLRLLTSNVPHLVTPNLPMHSVD